MASDPLSAALAEIRAEIEGAALAFPAQGIDPALASFAAGTLHGNALKALAALDAVLALHEPRPAYSPPGGLTCGYCTDAGGSVLLVTWPCQTRTVILAALTGKEVPGAR